MRPRNGNWNIKDHGATNNSDSLEHFINILEVSWDPYPDFQAAFDVACQWRKLRWGGGSAEETEEWEGERDRGSARLLTPLSSWNFPELKTKDRH